MGAFCSHPVDPETQAELERNKRINQEVKASKQADARSLKVLLLGSGESGKSTVFKQAKLIHESSYSREERKKFLVIIHQNIIECTQELLKGSAELEIPLDDEVKKYAEFMEEVTTEDTLGPDVVVAVKALWESPSIKSVYGRRNEIQLADSCAYFLEQIDRFIAKDALPTDQDILRSRVRSTGVVEMQFKIDEAIFRFFDVGGQRNERRKWIHQFDGVNAVLFVSSLSEYDQNLYEQANQNRMLESISVFGEVCNLPSFKDAPTILFLNKRDLFEEKIKRSDLTKTFPDYTGGFDYDAGVEFIKQKYLSMNTIKKKIVFVHVVCATDTDNMRIVLRDIEQTILNRTLAGSGIV